MMKRSSSSPTSPPHRLAFASWALLAALLVPTGVGAFSISSRGVVSCHGSHQQPSRRPLQDPAFAARLLVASGDRRTTPLLRPTLRLARRDDEDRERVKVPRRRRGKYYEEDDDDEKDDWSAYGEERRDRYYETEEDYLVDEDEYDVAGEDWSEFLDSESKNLDDLLENAVIPNPILDSIDPDGAADRFPELASDPRFWIDMALFIAFLNFLSWAGPRDPYPDIPWF